MKDIFLSQLSETRIRDFNDGFKEKTVPIEVRTDRFTGRVSRILPFRLKVPAPSHPLGLVAEAKVNCPFCPERLESSTPMFPDDVIPGGRLRHGNSVVIPNAFPYCSFCGVTIFAPDHYIPMDRFTTDILTDALAASLKWFDALYAHDPSITYYSVNWNYMPTAGGSLFHPHFQVVAYPEPTTFQRHLMNGSVAYQARHGTSFWSDLIEFEKKQKDRYMFSEDNVEFLASFSPGGIFGEVLALFRHVESIDAVSDGMWGSFLRGLVRTLRGFHRLNLDNLNMTLLLSRAEAPGMWVQARIMPRIVIPPWGTSDVNYFEKGHDEKVVVFPPEQLAMEIKRTQ